MKGVLQSAFFRFMKVMHVMFLYIEKVLYICKTKEHFNQMGKTYKFFYDLETTGVDFRKNSIIQLHAKIELDGKIAEEIDLLMQPHPKAVIEAEALKVNGRTEAEIKGFPYTQKSAYNEILRVLSRYIDRFDRSEKMHLVGFNNKSFDDLFFRKLFELNGDAFFNSWFWSESLDVMTLAGQYLIGRRPHMTNFKLLSVAKELGVTVDEKRLHEGGYDVEITRQVYKIVTGQVVEPAKDWHFYFCKSTKEVWKTFHAESVLADGVAEINFSTFRKLLRQRGTVDGPNLIKDDLI